MAFLEINQCRGFARLHRLRVLSCQQKLFACLVTKATESEKTEVSRHPKANSCPINEYGVPLIPDKLRSKLFSNVSHNKKSEAATKQVSAIIQGVPNLPFDWRQSLFWDTMCVCVWTHLSLIVIF